VNLANAAGTFDIAGTTAGATITTLNGVANSHVTLGARTLTISTARPPTLASSRVRVGWRSPAARRLSLAPIPIPAPRT